MLNMICEISYQVFFSRFESDSYFYYAVLQHEFSAGGFYHVNDLPQKKKRLQVLNSPW